MYMSDITIFYLLWNIPPDTTPVSLQSVPEYIRILPVNTFPYPDIFVPVPAVHFP